MLERLPGLVGAAPLARWREGLALQPGGSLNLAEALDLDEVLVELRPLRRRWGEGLRVLSGQCWVRRAQPGHYWHQDGALHHDFLLNPTDAPLPLFTLWLPLVRCGVDAPGLAWVQPSLTTLLSPAELDDNAVQARFGHAIEQPTLEAGEALLFDGGLLHRTYITPGMRQQRTSIELRFIAAGAVPPALAKEPLRTWD